MNLISKQKIPRGFQRIVNMERVYYRYQARTERYNKFIKINKEWASNKLQPATFGEYCEAIKALKIRII